MRKYKNMSKYLYININIINIKILNPFGNINFLDENII